METWSWLLEHNNDVHIIELDHEPQDGVCTVRVNAVTIVDEKNNKKDASIIKFYVDDLLCLMYIKYYKKKYQYELKYKKAS